MLLDLLVLFFRGPLTQLSGGCWWPPAALNTVRTNATWMFVECLGPSLWTPTFAAHPSVWLVHHLPTLCVCVCVTPLCVTSQSAGCRKGIHPVGWLPCWRQTWRSAGNDPGRSVRLYQGTASNTHSLSTPSAAECIIKCDCIPLNLFPSCQSRQSSLLKITGHFMHSIHSFRAVFSRPEGRSWGGRFHFIQIPWW